MKKLTVMVLGAMAALQGHAAAQGVDKLAYDFCYSLSCYVYFADPGGASTLWINNADQPTWSSDGMKIAFVGRYYQSGLFVLDLSDWSITRIASEGQSPALSPDGRRLAFSSGELQVINADGSGVAALTSGIGFRGQPAWSPDGLTIAFDCEVDAGNRDICAINANGAGFRRLTFNPGWDSGAAYSPDGLSIAFATTQGSTEARLSVMNPDGSGLSLVGAGIHGVEPAWSRVGERIAFVVPDEACHCGLDHIVIMNRDGTGQQPGGWYGYGNHPAWASPAGSVAWFGSDPLTCTRLTCLFNASSSWGGNGPLVSYSWDFGDGTTSSGSGPAVTHVYAAGGTFTVTLTVTNESGVIGTQSLQADVVDNMSPTASFSYGCGSSWCLFDGTPSSDPDGQIVDYAWDFGDGTSIEGDPAPFHAYDSAGWFAVTLVVTDDRGASASQQLGVFVNAWPIASFTAACTVLTCTFDGSGSSDPDGVVTSYTWSFGDGTSGSGAATSHVYSAGGTYAVTLTVTDNFGATSVHTGTVTAVQPTLHIGDLDGTATSQQHTWTGRVTVTLHDSSHGPLANARVTGVWSVGGTLECSTDGAGKCLLSSPPIPRNTRSVTFTILSVTKHLFLYTPGGNHDPEGESNGTSITVSR